MTHIFLVAAVAMFLSHAHAQQAAPAAPVASDIASAAIPPGLYKGRVVQQGGSMSSDFELDLRQHPGRMAMFRARYPCSAHLPASIVGVNDGVVRPEMVPVQIAGCERTVEVKVSGNELIGTMKAYGNSFDVKATKQ